MSSEGTGPGELSKVARRQGARMGISLMMGCLPLVIIGGALAVLLVVGLIDERLIAPVFWVGFLSFPPLCVIVGVGVGLVLRRRNLGPLEAALAAWGPSKSYVLTGRQWKAQRGGRDLTVQVSKQGLVVSLQSKPTVGLRVGRSSLITGLVTKGRPHRELGEGVFVVGDEEQGLARVLDTPGIPEALRVALGNDGQSLRILRVHPTRGLTLTIRHLPTAQKTPEAFGALFDALAAVAIAAE